MSRRRCVSTRQRLGCASAASSALACAIAAPSTEREAGTGCVSGMKKNAATRSASAIPAAASGGAHAPKWLTDDPSTGPSTIPRPIPAPSRPMPAARASPCVTSAIAAWQAARFPAVAPAMMRETKRSQRSDVLVASAKSTIDAAFPASEIRITGRRPRRSESRPRNGVATSCVNENEARMKPTVSADPDIDFT